MKIEHFALNVENPVATVAWYEQHLGMKVIRSNVAVNQMHFIVDDAGRVVIEIYNNPASPMPDYNGMNPLMFHIAFVVDDIEAERDRLITAGASAEGDIDSTPAGDRLAFLRDPWGVPLQLVKRATPMID